MLDLSRRIRFEVVQTKLCLTALSIGRSSLTLGLTSHGFLMVERSEFHLFASQEKT